MPVSPDERRGIVLQVTNLNPIKDEYTPIQLSAEEIIGEVLQHVKKEKILGVMIVAINANGDTESWYSRGIERQRRIGILMDMVHALLKA